MVNIGKDLDGLGRRVNLNSLFTNPQSMTQVVP